MHIFSVIAHPRPESFCHAISQRARDCLVGAGHSIEHHDLYFEEFNPCLNASEAYTVGDTLEEALIRTDDQVVLKHRQSVGKSDGLLVVHPNWWGKPPAILAGWMDRVLVPGVAYRLETADGRPEPLLQAKSAVVFNTSDTDAERERIELGDPLEAIWLKCVLPYCGVEASQRHVFRPVVGSSQAMRASWLDEVQAVCERAFSVV